LKSLRDRNLDEATFEEKLDIDPFQFLKKNFVKPGDGYFLAGS
jgi:hypothetical protein